MAPGIGLDETGTEPFVTQIWWVRLEEFFGPTVWFASGRVTVELGEEMTWARSSNRRRSSASS